MIDGLYAHQEQELHAVAKRRRKLYDMGYDHGSTGRPRHEVVGCLWPTYNRGYDDAQADIRRITRRTA